MPFAFISTSLDNKCNLFVTCAKGMNLGIVDAGFENDLKVYLKLTHFGTTEREIWTNLKM
jgi:hypothetical protein